MSGDPEHYFLTDILDGGLGMLHGDSNPENGVLEFNYNFNRQIYLESFFRVLLILDAKHYKYYT